MPKPKKKPTKILGQDLNVLLAAWANILSWLVETLFPSLKHTLFTKCASEDTESNSENNTATRCISIGRPGGLEQLRTIRLLPNVMTVGYNVKNLCLPPFTPPLKQKLKGDETSCISSSMLSVPDDCVIVSNKYFSINYADCTIRWGLYESANEFVGFPIVPGFDLAGEIEFVGGEKHQDGFQEGDRVFGCTMFGAYSSRILVPKKQLRIIPSHLSSAEAAALPAVSLTALYTLFLAGAWPSPTMFTNKAVLVHSAAGGVGSMIVQMAKIVGLGPIVGVVGSKSKVKYAESLGCDVVIDKSSSDMWSIASKTSPNGYAAIFDANGVSTLKDSYDHLGSMGRLIIYGFHSNLPLGRSMLSPIEWVKMGIKMFSMPAFDPMDLTVSNRSVLAFNLSFFSEEIEVVTKLFDQVCAWLEAGKLRCPHIVEMHIDSIKESHELIQSGQSRGKIVVKTT